MLYLGLDSSTQGLKATIVGNNLEVVGQWGVNYDQELRGYHTEEGVHVNNEVEVTSPAIMWVEAIDLLFAKMVKDGAPLREVDAVSGSGQQHGSVWLRERAKLALAELSPKRMLKDQREGIFATMGSPVWMDARATELCRKLEEEVGGPQALADITGSRAYERFTYNIIRWFAENCEGVYGNTERICLVSSFIASLLRGKISPIDYSDGSGMNLLDINRKYWSGQVLGSNLPDLIGKLGRPVASHAVLGPIHHYFHKYGFKKSCQVVTFSGDNPCSLAGLRIQKPGDVAISMGTSDTEFASTTKASPSGVEGHIFVNPIDPAAYMAMICYKGGSLAREKVRDQVAGGEWETFSEMLGQTEPGNEGFFAIHIPKKGEITPPIPHTKAGVHRFGPDGVVDGEFDPKVEVRAVVEAHFLSMREHGTGLGLKPKRILATGGASANEAMLQVIADIFGVDVLTADVTDSASLGAAFRAAHGMACHKERRFVPFGDVLARSDDPFKLAAEPDKGAHKVYTGMAECVLAAEKLLME